MNHLPLSNEANIIEPVRSTIGLAAAASSVGILPVDPTTNVALRATNAITSLISRSADFERRLPYAFKILSIVQKYASSPRVRMLSRKLMYSSVDKLLTLTCGIFFEIVKLDANIHCFEDGDVFLLTNRSKTILYTPL